MSVGRYDACIGIFFKGDGKGGFAPLTILQSGIFIPGNGKSLTKLRNGAGGLLVAASQNRNPLYLFTARKPVKTIPVKTDDLAAIITMKDGRKQRTELGYGSSAYSQSGRFLIVPSVATSCEIINVKGDSRALPIN